VRYILAHPDATRARERAVAVDVRAMQGEVRRGLSKLTKARNMVERDDAVLSGTPCFRGTRIPVHDVTDMLANGDSVEALSEAYPRLSEGQIELATTVRPRLAALPPRCHRHLDARVLAEAAVVRVEIPAAAFGEAESAVLGSPCYWGRVTGSSECLAS